MKNSASSALGLCDPHIAGECDISVSFIICFRHERARNSFGETDYGPRVRQSLAFSRAKPNLSTIRIAAWFARQLVIVVSYAIYPPSDQTSLFRLNQQYTRLAGTTFGKQCPHCTRRYS
jgi:hypothetical protein